MTTEPMGAEITKSFLIATPTEPGYQGKPVKRKFKLGEIERACWQARCAGADDDTEVEFPGYNRTGIEFLDIPAWAVEIPPALRVPATREVVIAPPVPHIPLWRRVHPLTWVGLVAAPFLLPLLIALLGFLWRLA